MRALVGRRTRRLVVTVAALFAVAAGVAYATIPDSGGVFTACKLNALGTIRLIDPSGPTSSLLSHCTTYETQIGWNQKGPAGTAGATGAQGPKGDTGATGSQGAVGAPGPRGPQGDVGTQGPQGAKGDTGPHGANGISPAVTPLLALDPACPTGGAVISDGLGDPAVNVCNGLPGSIGLTGATGQLGPKGDPGATGATGPQGPKGDTGPQGPPGAPGKDGSGSGLTKIDDLNRVACTDVNGAASNVVVSLAADGSLSLKCTTVPLPPPPVGSVTLTPSSISATRIGAGTATRTFTLSNNTTNPINISSVQQDGIAVGGCGTQMAPGATCSITVSVTVQVICDSNATTVTVIGTESVTGTPFTLSANLDLTTFPHTGQLCP